MFRAQAEQQKRILEEKEKQRIITRTGQAPHQTSNASSDNNQIAAAAGPRRAKTPASKKRTLSTKTNKSIIKNALMHVSLAGSLNKDLKQEVIQVRHRPFSTSITLSHFLLHIYTRTGSHRFQSHTLCPLVSRHQQLYIQRPLFLGSSPRPDFKAVRRHSRPHDNRRTRGCGILQV